MKYQNQQKNNYLINAVELIQCKSEKCYEYASVLLRG
jgi:hypothetical protein